jgi:hypothetical protein
LIPDSKVFSGRVTNIYIYLFIYLFIGLESYWEMQQKNLMIGVGVAVLVVIVIVVIIVASSSGTSTTTMPTGTPMSSTTPTMGMTTYPTASATPAPTMQAAYTYLGCYEAYTSTSTPTFAYQAENGSTSGQGFDVDECAYIAKISGATYFGLQYVANSGTATAQCWYGDSSTDYAAGGTATSTYVDDHGLVVGGANVNAVYQLMGTGTIYTPPYSYLGCYGDSNTTRALPGGPSITMVATGDINNQVFDANSCASFAYSAGATYFGLQDISTNGTATAACFYGTATADYSEYGTTTCAYTDDLGNAAGGPDINATYMLS